MELVRFLAAVFYGGPEVLHSFSELPDVYGVVPLTFYTAQGREIQDAESTSYYNLAEVEEIVERVSTLVQCWPDEWNDPGVSPAESILVVTPYLDQVILIIFFLLILHWRPCLWCIEFRYIHFNNSFTLRYLNRILTLLHFVLISSSSGNGLLVSVIIVINVYDSFM